MTSEELAKKALVLASTKKAENGKVLDLRELTSMTDYFVICHGTSEIQVRAIATAIRKGIDKQDALLHHQEGYDFGRWILLDYVDVVIHVFHGEEREFYSLENLWSDAPESGLVEDSENSGDNGDM